MKKKQFLLFLSLFLGINIFAQHENAIWFSSLYPVKLSEKFELHSEIGCRFKGENTELYQHLYRFGLRYGFNENINSAVGFALFFTDGNWQSEVKKFGTEFRFWEELVYQKKIGTYKGALRLRQEERFYDDYNKKASYTAFRTRFMVQVNKKLNEHFSLQLANEYMYQFKSGTSGLDQNRIMGNVLYYPLKNLEIKCGYMEIILPNNRYTDTLVFGINKKL